MVKVDYVNMFTLQSNVVASCMTLPYTECNFFFTAASCTMHIAHLCT